MVTFLRVRRPKLKSVLATMSVSNKLFVLMQQMNQVRWAAYVKGPMAVENCIIAPAKVCRNSISGWNEVGTVAAGVPRESGPGKVAQRVQYKVQKAATRESPRQNVQWRKPWWRTSLMAEQPSFFRPHSRKHFPSYFYGIEHLTRDHLSLRPFFEEEEYETFWNLQLEPWKRLF